MEQFSPLLFSFVAIIVGLFMLVSGGESLVYGATRLAQRLNMTPYLIGLTVVAFGTSVPELFISLTASLQGHPDIMIGNVIGSNVANVGLIMGCCALLVPLKLDLQEVWTELIIVLMASVFLILCSGYGFFPRIVGFFFVLTLISYTYLTYANNKENIPPDQLSPAEQPQQRTLQPKKFPVTILLTIIIGLVLLGLGSQVFIQGAVSVARYFSISELIIGLTLTAVGTSLPELAASVAALRQKETGMLLGNIIGSNMFNLLMVLGLTGLFKPFELEKELLYRDLPTMFIFTVIIIPMLRKNGVTRRWHGVLLLAAYGGYCFWLL